MLYYLTALLPKFMHKLTIEENKTRKELFKQTNRPRCEVYLILDNIRSAHNVGAIFRTCDGAGVSRVYLCGITPTPPNKEIEKTALGTVDSVPWEYYESSKELIIELKSRGVQIVALEITDQSVDYRQFDYMSPTAIVLGNEVEGIEEEVLALADSAIEIPMHGMANSLNVATSAAIIVFYLSK